jgi:acyl-CoA thioesterase
MAVFDRLLASVEREGDGFAVAPDESWQQGRTLYGGLSAALALNACERLVPDLPMLRAGQIAFIGPAAGRVTLRPNLVRRGKSVTYMACDLLCEGAVALRALFAFGAARASAYRADAPPPPTDKGPDDCPAIISPMQPAFLVHFHQHLAGTLLPMAGAEQGALLAWVRHRGGVAPGLSALVALGDLLPPASMTRFKAPAMISTMTWSFDLFDPERALQGFREGEGWMLLESRDDGVGDGYAGQDMAMWDRAGRPVLRARQSVALFG